MRRSQDAERISRARLIRRASRLAAANQSRNNARAAVLIPICCSRHEIWPNFRLDLILFSLIGAPLTHVLINFYLLISRARARVPPLKLHLPGIITRAQSPLVQIVSRPDYESGRNEEQGTFFTLFDAGLASQPEQIRLNCVNL